MTPSEIAARARQLDDLCTPRDILKLVQALAEQAVPPKIDREPVRMEVVSGIPRLQSTPYWNAVSDKTKGEEIAERMVGGGSCNVIVSYRSHGIGFNVTEGTDGWARRGLKEVIAAAIDGALAERDKEWFEAFAGFRDTQLPSVPTKPDGVAQALRTNVAYVTNKERERCAAKAEQDGDIRGERLAAEIRSEWFARVMRAGE